MQIQETFIEGLFIIKPKVYRDVRGFFYEFFNLLQFEKETGLKVSFIQDNLAKSQRGVLRGLHYQKAPYAQSKLVSVLSGAVYDVVVDLRKDSKTYGRYFAIELSAQNQKQLFIPKGLAHAYLTLEDDTLFFYKIDQIYHPESESGIRYDDPDINIEWPFDMTKILLSAKDQNLPYFKDLI